MWLDIYQWPAATAAVPTDGTVLYDNLGLPHVDIEFMALINQNRAAAEGGSPVDPSVDLLLRLAVAAKYLACGDTASLARVLPALAQIPPGQVAEDLRERATSMTNSRLATRVGDGRDVAANRPRRCLPTPAVARGGPAKTAAIRRRGRGRSPCSGNPCTAGGHCPAGRHCRVTADCLA